MQPRLGHRLILGIRLRHCLWSFGAKVEEFLCHNIFISILHISNYLFSSFSAKHIFLIRNLPLSCCFFGDDNFLTVLLAVGIEMSFPLNGSSNLIQNQLEFLLVRK